MKTITFLSAILLTANTLFGQVNYCDTSFYSPALDKEKMVRIYHMNFTITTAAIVCQWALWNGG